MNSSIANPVDFYQDLNFPTVFKIKRVLRNRDIEIDFCRNASNAYFDRIFRDNYFMLRKKNIAKMMKILKYPIRVIIRYIPIYFLPILDVNIKIVKGK